MDGRDIDEKLRTTAVRGQHAATVDPRTVVAVHKVVAAVDAIGGETASDFHRASTRAYENAVIDEVPVDEAFAESVRVGLTEAPDARGELIGAMAADPGLRNAIAHLVEVHSPVGELMAAPVSVPMAYLV